MLDVDDASSSHASHVADQIKYDGVAAKHHAPETTGSVFGKPTRSKPRAGADKWATWLRLGKISDRFLCE